MSDISEKPGLYPTKTRLALLREAATLKVYRDANGHDYDNHHRQVDARIGELALAGWVVFRFDRDDTIGLIGIWEITDAGCAVLAAAESPGGAA